jgi:coenzyme F420-0:L-glutamate ligase/coenzyme F420-1:gamma-L-glutamate ligase
MSEMRVIPIAGIPEVQPGDDLPTLIRRGIDETGAVLEDRDVVVVTHKIVSKAEGRARPAPNDAAYRTLVDDEAASVVRRRGDLTITQTTHGFICANAGVDRSNAAAGTALLLPLDPDRSAHRIRRSLERSTGTRIGVAVTDTFGRPWRRGLADVAIGISGIPAIVDLRGEVDSFGRTLDVTEVAVADEIAAAADLVMGKADRIPVAIVRGLDLDGEGRATDLIRPADEDLFR